MAETKISKAQAGSGIWTSDSLVAGTNISITEVQQPVIDEHTEVLFHFDTEENPNYGTDTGVTSLRGYNLSASVNTSFGYCTRLAGSGMSFTKSVAWGIADYTVDFWMHLPLSGFNGTSSFVLACPENIAYGSVGISSDDANSSSYNIVPTINGSWITSSPFSNIQKGAWNHFAFERESGVTRMYCNGVLQYTTNASYNYSTAGKIEFQVGGKQYGSVYEEYGLLDELRISNVARYQGNNFTPFTAPYSAATGETQYQINNTQAAADTDLSNVTSTGKATAIGWLKPDLTAGVSLTSGDNPPGLGYVQFKGSNISNAYCFCYINSVQVVQLGSTGTQNGEIAGLYLVDSTDTITATSATITFYPAIGA